jgi:hypothetical protein
MLRKVLSRVNTQRVTTRCSYRLRSPVLKNGGGVVVAVPRCVDWMMIWEALFSPVLVGSHGGSGQGSVTAVPQAAYPMFLRRF